MGARKGQNNFKAHQKQVGDAGMLRIERVLKVLPRRTRYLDFHAFSRAVALAADLHPTTVSRSARYRKALLDHLIANPTLLTDPPEETVGRSTLKARSVGAEIEVASLRRENARLRKLFERRPASLVAGGPDAPTGGEGDKRFELAFDRTATVLARVLSRLSEKDMGILTDVARREILDGAEGGSRRVIAGRPDTAAFFEWMETQRLNERMPERD